MISSSRLISTVPLFPPLIFYSPFQQLDQMFPPLPPSSVSSLQPSSSCHLLWSSVLRLVCSSPLDSKKATRSGRREETAPQCTGAFESHKYGRDDKNITTVTVNLRLHGEAQAPPTTKVSSGVSLLRSLTRGNFPPKQETAWSSKKYSSKTCLDNKRLNNSKIHEVKY